MLTGKFEPLYRQLLKVIPPSGIFHDPLYTLAFGTDASYFRMIPEMVIITTGEEEVSLILKECSRLKIPVTFRAAGTSLSGQAVTDSLLVIAGSSWKKFRIEEKGLKIRLQPGLTGEKVNKLLSSYNRKIGPDPASIHSAMIGGIAANNASGMCCGTAENSYKTLDSMRIIFADGFVLDTADPESRERFMASHPQFIQQLQELVREVRANPELSARISRKFKMKNTTGYSLNALVDFDDPFEVIQHLMIGSEGTLGFISEITYRTVVEHRFKASSLMVFPDIRSACTAVSLLKAAPVSAVELIDRAGLRSVEDQAGMPDWLKTLSPGASAILVETRAETGEMLQIQINQILQIVASVPAEIPVRFTDKPLEYDQFWKIRKGLFPSVGAMRKNGTTVIIEDVAFPVHRLAEATTDLQDLLHKWGYHEAVIFGHALEGNLHFVFTQDFGSPEEVNRYKGFINEVADLVVRKYDGSLKAEHGTGRNMAPFVELEWGSEAYELMWRIKKIFDPDNLLNPGVILNSDPEAHLKNLKPIPAASDIIDKCIECGFCEPSCVSADLTLTPRQRIVVFREMTRLRHTGREPHTAAALADRFRYHGNETCATDGLCATACPVGIDTGKLVKSLRGELIGKNQKTARWIAGHMAETTAILSAGLSVAGFFHSLFGTSLMSFIAAGLRKLSVGRIPRWNRWLPSGAARIRPVQPTAGDSERKVVYFPSCINRSMGNTRGSREKQLTEKMTELLHKGGFQVIWPENLDKLCCGMAFSSKGYAVTGKQKSAELEAALQKASGYGKYPVLCDMSPCLYTMKETFTSGIRLYEPVEFILEQLLPHLTLTPLQETVTVFPVCSMKKMGLESKLAELAGKCAAQVIVPETNCCGFAGDRGFSFPELNAHGLRMLKPQLPAEVTKGFSTSRTCEIGLSLHSGIDFRSIVYLVDRVSESKADQDK